ncbi:MAG: hypothetical protein Q7R69_01130 [bacterium]|nr:hypothetical protein [bacterium]
MNRKIIPLILMFSIVSLASPALAKEPNVRTQTETRKVEAQTRKASSTDARAEMQRGLAKRKAANTSRVLTATVERLERIIVRLESRIEKVKADGGVTATSTAYVVEARNHLSLTKASIALFASVDLSGDKAKENFERVRDIASEAKGHIREAHRSLTKAIRALGGERSATSTPED